MDIKENLMFYKTALSFFVGKKIHLQLKDGEIDWIEAVPPDLRGEMSMSMQCYRFFQRTIKSIDKTNEDFFIQKRAGDFCRWIESAFGILDDRQKHIVFMSFIDWDMKDGEKKFLSNCEIARRMGVTENAIRKTQARCLTKIKEHLTNRGK